VIQVAKCSENPWFYREKTAFISARSFRPETTGSINATDSVYGPVDSQLTKRLIAEEIAAKPAAREQALQDDDLKGIHEFIRSLPTTANQALDQNVKSN